MTIFSWGAPPWICVVEGLWKGVQGLDTKLYLRYYILWDTLASCSWTTRCAFETSQIQSIWLNWWFRTYSGFNNFSLKSLRVRYKSFIPWWIDNLCSINFHSSFCSCRFILCCCVGFWRLNDQNFINWFDKSDISTHLFTLHCTEVSTDTLKIPHSSNSKEYGSCNDRNKILKNLFRNLFLIAFHFLSFEISFSEV